MVSGGTLLVAVALKVLQGAARGGFDLQRLFADIGMDPAILADPSARIDRRVFIDLMLAVMQQTEDEFMGFGQGYRTRPGTFSMMAHAVINCATLEKAIRRAAHLRNGGKSARRSRGCDGGCNARRCWNFQ